MHYVLLIGVLLTLAIAAGWAIHSLTGNNEEVPKKPGAATGLDVPPSELVAPPVLKPLAGKPWLTAAEQTKVDAAVGRGVAYFSKKSLTGDQLSANISQTAVNASSGTGWVGLAGLTLLHCDVATKDSAVQKAAEVVRKGVPELLNTYEMGACIWFLDRLNEPADRKLIQTLALRLVASQQADGGWPYFCTDFSDADQERLLELLRSDSAPPPRTPERFSQLSVLKVQAGEKIVLTRPARQTTTSLTLFAMLGLWVAQKHGVPADRSLALAEQRLAAGQLADGQWRYGAPGYSLYDSSTCAGLLALAIGRGVAAGAWAPSRTTRPCGKDLTTSARKSASPPFAARRAGGTSLEPTPGAISFSCGRWSEWPWSTTWRHQRQGMVSLGRRAACCPPRTPTAAGRTRWSAEVDTCFALLFLQRANVATDLTEKLRQPTDGFRRAKTPK